MATNNDLPDTKEHGVMMEKVSSDEVDTFHNDEALKVFNAYDGPTEWSPAEEKKVVRFIDRRVMSILFVTYGLQFYDKSMLAQAVSIIRRSLSLILTQLGIVWHHSGNRSYRPTILLGLCDLLPGFHLGIVPRGLAGPALPHRTCSCRYCHLVGNM
jgi:hypothetical protein